MYLLYVWVSLSLQEVFQNGRTVGASCVHQCSPPIPVTCIDIWYQI